VPSSSQPATDAPTQWGVTIFEEDFNGEANCFDGGRIRDFGYDGTRSILLKKMQCIISTDINITGYSDIKVDFVFWGKNLETTDSFKLDYCFDSSYQWAEGGNWTRIQNKNWIPETVTFSTIGADKVVIRFQVDFNDAKKKIFADNIIVSGKLGLPSFSPTDRPTSPVSPTDAPTQTPTVTQIWESIFSETFENGKGEFQFGKFEIVDRDRNGNSSIRIKKTTSARTDWYPVLDYSQLKVDFSFLGESMEPGEAVSVDFKFGKHSSRWNEEKRWTFGEEFENGIWHEASATVEIFERCKVKNIFVHNKFKFRLKGHGDQGNDKVYFDNVTLSAITEQSSQYM